MFGGQQCFCGAVKPCFGILSPLDFKPWLEMLDLLFILDNKTHTLLAIRPIHDDKIFKVRTDPKVWILYKAANYASNPIHKFRVTLWEITCSDPDTLTPNLVNYAN